MLLSIIIPCYNSDSFLGATLDMLLTQDIDDCEIILVNDGSTDNTLEIMNEFARRNSFIKVLDQCNQGVSVARNNGIKISSGKYLYFFDSDDAITDGTLAFYKKIITESPDIDCFGLGYGTFFNGKIKKKYSFKNFDGLTETGDYFLNKFLTKQLCLNICSCLFSSELIKENNILFPVGEKIGEDVSFLMKVYSMAYRCRYFSRLSFVYQLRAGSATNGLRGYDYEKFKFLPLQVKTLGQISDCKDDLKQAINFFLSYSWHSAMMSYLLFGSKDRHVEEGLKVYSYLRKKAIIGKPFIKSIMFQIMRIFPISMLLKLKHFR